MTMTPPPLPPVKRKRKVLKWLLAGGALYALFGCYPAEKYRAEVGYYEGDKERWQFGSDTTREQCTNEAIALYNSINHKSPGRAFSWACLRVSADGSRILGRVR
jgi:hypothetical protein